MVDRKRVNPGFDIGEILQKKRQPYLRRSYCDPGSANRYGGDGALSGPLGDASSRRGGARQDCAQHTKPRAAAGEHHRLRV